MTGSGRHDPAPFGQILVVAAARCVLAALAGLLVAAAVPAVLGGAGHVVTSGSMRPALQVGDVLVSRPGRVATPGRIVAVHDPARAGRVLVHRVVGTDDRGGLLTQGDANNARDSSPVPAGAVIGVVVLRVPIVGRPVVWAHERRTGPLAAVAAGVLACGVLATRTPGRRAGPARPIARHACGPRRARPRLRARHALPAMVFLSALWLPGQGGLADAAFTGQTTNGGNSFAATATFPTYPQAVLADSPSRYYRSDDAAGSATAADSSGNGVTGQYVSTVPSFQVTGSPASGGAAGTAVRFPVAGSFATAHSNAQLTNPNPVTQEIWFKTTSTVNSRPFVFGQNQSGNSFLNDRQIRIGGNGRISYFAGSTTIDSPAAGYNDGAWHLVTATLGPSGMKLYVDGALVASNAGTTTGQNITAYWRIGGDNEYIDGNLDEAAVYLSELPAARVSAHYAAATSPATYTAAVTADSPWALWHLDDAPAATYTSANSTFATTMADSSGQNHPGTYRFLRPLSVTTGGAGALVGASAASTSAAFAGSGGGYDPTPYSGPTSFTLELWFRTTSTTGGLLIGYGNTSSGLSGSHDRAVYMRDNGRLRFGVDSTHTVSSAAAYNNGAWHHLAATYASADARLYVDGALVAGTAAAGSPATYTGYWRWGGDTLTGWPGAPTSAWFLGDLDEVAIYPTQLDAQQVAHHYHANH